MDRPKAGEKVKRPYNGTSFIASSPLHDSGRDPLGNGTGGPATDSKTSFTAIAPHQGRLLSMANAGPNTNGSQFFILSRRRCTSTPHSVFGELVKGEEC